jgi:outer membrane protein OmpA-like peptidoglycan-associated protein
MFPYVNADETFYFSSDGHSGIGGLDIFKVSGSGTNWGKVKNLGAPINSSADDFGIVYNEEKNKGYFTSDRSGGSGSDDIYKFIDEGITLEGIIVDAKTDKPICEATSELVYLGEIIGDRVGECDGMFEYSVLPGRDYSIEGCADGYECNAVQTTTKGVKPGGKVFVKIPLIKPDPLDMEVLVIDKITKEPIPGAKVVAFNKCVKSYDDRIADANGMSYYQEVTVDCQYNVSANAESYMPADKDVLVDGTQNPVRVVIELEKIGTSPLVLRHIYYDFDQSYIREEAELDLNKVFNFMNINPGTIVEIGSHTDARASFKYNERLSERRAKAAVEWLIQRGISKDRLVAVGYGEYQLTNGCKDNVQCEEIDHQKNRRTEFRVLDNVLGIDVKSIERNNMLVDPCLKCPF